MLTSFVQAPGHAFLPAWDDGGSPDPGLAVFRTFRSALPAVRPGGSVLEIGCADTPWLRLARQADPTLRLCGVDWRAAKPVEGAFVLRGDIFQQTLTGLDAVVSLSTIEHLGLGHYAHDPIHPEGDIKAIDRVRHWLRPGGWCYFDVPYTPEGYQLLHETECRCYDDTALQFRFGPHRVLGYTTLSGEPIPKPAQNARASRPFYYVAVLIHAAP